MKTCTLAVAILLSAVTTAQAARERASYDIGLAMAVATLPAGDSTLVVQVDSSKKDTPKFLVVYDSLTFTWIPTKTFVEYELQNDTRGQVQIMWDSATAIDPEGRLMRLVPYERGEKTNWEFSIPPRKVRSGARVEGELGVVRREPTGALVMRDMLPVRNEDFPFDDFSAKVKEQVGKRYRLIMVIERDQTIQRFTFAFVVRDAQIRSL